MATKIQFIGRITCHDCGTGYGKSAPLATYETGDSPLVLCDECAEEREDYED